MIVAPDLTRLSPAERAKVILSEAQSDIKTRLWRAALGTSEDQETDSTSDRICRDRDLDALLAQLTGRTFGKQSLPPTPSQAIAEEATGKAPVLPSATPATSVVGLGPNTHYRETLHAAAERTGIPAAALAAIVDAEAAKDCGGSWKTGSRNPRSSAAGLGQFLGGTWQSEAERTGTWLHATAVQQGWIGDNGKVLPSARSALLALRYDGAASINATADYARQSVAKLKQAGIAVGEDVGSISRAAYLGHHLGLGDAIRFLKGGLDNGRARRLLDAQVGVASASRRIAQTGDAAVAHRSWLLDFVGRHVDPKRFESDRKTT